MKIYPANIFDEYPWKGPRGDDGEDGEDGTGGGGGGLTTVAVTDTATIDLTLTGNPTTGYVLKSDLIGLSEGHWIFTNASNDMNAFYGTGYVWNYTTTPDWLERLAIARVDSKGIDHGRALDNLAPGDEVWMQWGGSTYDTQSGIRWTVRNKQWKHASGFNSHLVLSCSGPLTGAQAPGGGNGLPIRIGWHYRTAFIHGSYLMDDTDTGGNSPVEPGFARFNVNPRTTPGSVTTLYLSTLDLIAQPTSLRTYGASVGSQFVFHLDQGGRLNLTTTGAVPTNPVSAGTGDYYAIPVTVASRTGYLGKYAWLEVLAP